MTHLDVDFVDIIQDEVHVFIKSDNDSFKSYIDNVIQPDLKWDYNNGAMTDQFRFTWTRSFFWKNRKSKLIGWTMTFWILWPDMFGFVQNSILKYFFYNFIYYYFYISLVFRYSIHPNFILDNKKLIESALSGSNFDLSCCPQDKRSDWILDFERIKILFISSPQSNTKQNSKTDDANLIISFRLFPSRHTKLIARNIFYRSKI